MNNDIPDFLADHFKEYEKKVTVLSVEIREAIWACILDHDPQLSETLKLVLPSLDLAVNFIEKDVIKRVSTHPVAKTAANARKFLISAQISATEARVQVLKAQLNE